MGVEGTFLGKTIAKAQEQLGEIKNPKLAAAAAGAAACTAAYVASPLLARWWRAAAEKRRRRLAAPVRLGILGAARIAVKNCKAIEAVPGSVVVRAVASRDPAKAEAFVAANGLPEGTKCCSYDELIGDPDIDAVYIPLPTSMHVEWVQKAAAAGKHVLLEKPVALTDTGTDQIFRICQMAHVANLDGTMFSHDMRWEEIDRAVAAGELGDVTNVRASFSFTGLAEGDIRTHAGLDGLGCLGDIGWYSVRAAMRIFDYELPKRVMGHAGARRYANGVLKDCGATLEWSGGRVATIDCSFERPYENRVVASSATASLELVDAFLPADDRGAAYTVTRHTGVFGKDAVAREWVVTPVPQVSRMWLKFAELCAAPRSRESLEYMRQSIAIQRVVCAIERSLHCTNPESETPVRLPAMESPVPSTANGAAGPGGSEEEEEAV